MIPNPAHLLGQADQILRKTTWADALVGD